MTQNHTPRMPARVYALPHYEDKNWRGTYGTKETEIPAYPMSAEYVRADINAALVEALDNVLLTQCEGDMSPNLRSQIIAALALAKGA